MPLPRLQTGGAHSSPHPAARHLLGWFYRVTHPGNPGDPQRRGVRLRGSPRICITGAHSMGAPRTGGAGVRKDPSASRGAAALGCAGVPKPSGAQNRGTPAEAAGQPRGAQAAREGAGSPYRSRPPCRSGDTWAWSRLGSACLSHRLWDAPRRPRRSHCPAAPPRPAQMCGPARSWRQPPAAQPRTPCILHSSQLYTPCPAPPAPFAPRSPTPAAPLCPRTPCPLRPLHPTLLT